MAGKNEYTVFDYLQWRGDLTLQQDPFNEVDNLVLCIIAYINLRKIDRLWSKNPKDAMPIGDVCARLTAADEQLGLSSLDYIPVMRAAAVALLLIKKVVRHWTGITACTLILSGGIGNIIDRIVHGYVVDMFDLQLFSYPVFNLADCCVVVGAILGGIYYLFLYEKYDKKKKEPDHAHDPSDPS